MNLIHVPDIRRFVRLGCEHFHEIPGFMSDPWALNSRLTLFVFAGGALLAVASSGAASKTRVLPGFRVSESPVPKMELMPFTIQASMY